MEKQKNIQKIKSKKSKSEGRFCWEGNSQKVQFHKICQQLPFWGYQNCELLFEECLQHYQNESQNDVAILQHTNDFLFRNSVHVLRCPTPKL